MRVSRADPRQDTAGQATSVSSSEAIKLQCMVRQFCVNWTLSNAIFLTGVTLTMPKLHGIVPPLITPLRGIDELDEPGLGRLIEHVLAGGVQGVFILGTTGEAPGLSYRLRRELIHKSCELVQGRVPVLVGVTDTSFIESIALAEVAAEAGATAVVLTTPYYFPAGQTELVDYVHNISQRLPLPIMLYNMPSLTKVWFELETLQRLASIDKIIGLKDSSGELSYLEQVLPLKLTRPDWSILVGSDPLLPAAVRLGADGGVSGGANICPRLFADCYEATIAGDRERQAELHDRILELQQIYEIGKYASRFLKATKCAASLLGICEDILAEPFHHFHPPERKRVRAILESMQIGPLRDD